MMGIPAQQAKNNSAILDNKIKAGTLDATIEAGNLAPDAIRSDINYKNTARDAKIAAMQSAGMSPKDIALTLQREESIRSSYLNTLQKSMVNYKDDPKTFGKLSLVFAMVNGTIPSTSSIDEVNKFLGRTGGFLGKSKITPEELQEAQITAQMYERRIANASKAIGGAGGVDFFGAAAEMGGDFGESE
jgi:hypothetical protein